MVRTVWRKILIVMACLALLLGLLFIRLPIPIHAATLEGRHSASTSQIICGQWNLIPSNSTNSVLEAVAGISQNDAWAVGFTDVAGNINNRQPFIIHWNGKLWKSVLSPTLSGNDNILDGVTAIASNNIWAVGLSNSFGGQAFMEHWDGISWSVTSSPSVGNSSSLYSITSVPGTNQLWAVGNYSASNSYNVLIERWDGMQWTVLPSPSIPSNDAALQSVTALSATDAWAVGWSSSAGSEQTLIEHWDGTSWSVVPSPDTSSSNILLSVTAAPNSNEAWAVGADSGGKISQTLIEHWDDSTWQVVPSPNLLGNNFLFASVASTSNDVWSVGYYHGGSKSLIEHWDGTQWSSISMPGSPTSHVGTLLGIAGVPNQTYVWAVGEFYTITNQTYHPLILLYC